jgi:nudix-type nucleoside diphosphatase (YffH/AdpP family)
MSVADRVRLGEVTVLADDWGVLKKTVFDFRRADGSWQRQTRETYDRGNGAVVLPYDPVAGRVILIRQFRFPAFVSGCDELMIEAPAGLLDAAAPEERIRAELEEEAGLRVREVERIWDVFMSPGSVTERLFFFVARYDSSHRAGTGGGIAAEGEDIEVLDLAFAEALQMTRDGRIRDAKTIMLLQHAALTIFAGRTGAEPASA